MLTMGIAAWVVGAMYTIGRATGAFANGELDGVAFIAVVLLSVVCWPGLLGFIHECE